MTIGANWSIVKTVCLVTLCASLFAPLAIPGGPAAAKHQCTTFHIGSYPLRTGPSTFVLLAPRDAARSASGEVFFAGSPSNYVLPDRPAIEKHVIGVVSDSVGNSRLITVPMRADSVESVRVTSLPDGRWAVAFIEITGVPNRSFPKTKHLWHGIHDGRRWILLDSIPIPPGEAIEFTSSSSLIHRGNVLTWAVKTDGPAQVLVFSRELSTTEWHVTRVKGTAAYLDLAYQDNGELLAAMVGGDRMFQPRADGNSLYVRGVNRPNMATLRAANYEDGDVHYPGFVSTPDGPLLVWTAVDDGDLFRGKLRAAYIDEQNVGPVIDVADSVIAQPPLIVPAGNGFPLVWVTEHEMKSDGGATRRLRFWQRLNGHIREIGHFPDRYLGTIIEVAWPGRVLLLGTETLSSYGGMPVSVIKSFEVVCKS